MKEPVPRVSIGVPVYNDAAYLHGALDALLNQSYTDIEIIISDNGSTDETRAICEEYAQRDTRVRYFCESQNRGASWNFNRVFELARGELFKWAAADDLCAPTFIERCVEVMDHEASVICCHARTMHIDSMGRPLDHLPDPTMDTLRFSGRKLDASSHRVSRRFLAVLLGSGWSARSAGVFRVNALQSTDLIQPYYGWEKVLMAELSLMGRFHDLPDILFFQRIHKKSSSSLNSLIDQNQFMNPFATNQLSFPRLKLLQGYLSIIWKHPLPFSTRLLCHICICRYLLQFSKWPGIFTRFLRGTGI